MRKATPKLITICFALFASVLSANSQSTWTQMAPFPGQLRIGAFAFSIGSNAYYGTGYNNGTFLNDVWSWNQATNTWTSVTTYPGAGELGCTSFVINGTAYVGFGQTGSTFATDLWAYNPTSNSWTQETSLPSTPRSDAFAFVINGKAYIGTGTPGGPPYLNDFWVYDPVANSWTSLGTYPGGNKSGVLGFAIGNYGYAGAGITDGSNLFNDFWQYNPSTDTWTSINSIPVPNNGLVGAYDFVIGGDGYVGLGSTSPGGGLISSFWAYDTNYHQWDSVASLPAQAREQGEGFAIGNNGYIVGGRNSSNTYLGELWQYTLPFTVSISATSNPVCLADSTLLTATNASAYLWSTGATTSSITVSPTATISYYVKAVNPADSADTASGSITVTVSIPPVVSISASDSSTCLGGSVVLVANGASTYLWSNGLTNDTVTIYPDSTSNYAVTGFTTAGCLNTAYQPITVTSPVTLTILASAVSICKGDSVNLAAGVRIPMPKSGPPVIMGPPKLFWSNGATTGAITVSPTSTTQYIVIDSETNGCIAIANTVITVNNNPTVTINSSSNSICSGTSAMLSASGAKTYIWSDSATTDSISVSPGIQTAFSVTGTDSNGCVGSATQVISVIPDPNVNISPSITSLCAGSSATIVASGGLNYLWSDGETTKAITVSPNTNITYSVVGTDSNGCQTTASESIPVIAPISVPMISSGNTLCQGGSATITAGVAGAYLWSNGEVTNNITVTPNVSTKYIVTITDSHGCVNSGTDSITVDSIPLVSINPSNATINPGNSIELSPSGAATYSWTPPVVPVGHSDSVIVSPALTTTYTVTGTNAAGCTNIQTVTVNVTNSSTISISPASPVICSGSSITLTASGGKSYSWSTGHAGASVTVSPTITTTYSVTAKVGSATETQTITVVVNSSPSLVLGPVSPLICSGNTIALTANGANNYTWSPAATLNVTTGNNVSASPATTTTYTVTGTSTSGCTTTGTLKVTVHTAPIIKIAGKDSLCSGDTITLTASGAGASGTYAWNVGATTSSIAVSPDANVLYSVIGTDANSCTGTATKNVLVNSTPTVVATATESSICKGNSTTITAAGANTYKWSTGSTGNSITVSPAATNTYTVKGFNNGCQGSTTQTITVNNCGNGYGCSSPVVLGKLPVNIIDSAYSGSSKWYKFTPDSSTDVIVLTPLGANPQSIESINVYTSCSSSAILGDTINDTLPQAQLVITGNSFAKGTKYYIEVKTKENNQGSGQVTYNLSIHKPFNSTLNNSSNSMLTLKPNDFRIGMFGFYYNQTIATTQTTIGGYPTSTLNVLAQDGFNTILDYNAFTYQSTDNEIENLLTMAHLNGMMAVPSVKDFFVPSSPTPTCLCSGDPSLTSCDPGGPVLNPGGTNLYTGGGWCYADFNDLFQNVYSVYPYNTYIWGYHTAEEPEWEHYLFLGPSCNAVCSEIPPTNVSKAIGYYRSLLVGKGVIPQKMDLMPAHHWQTLNQWTISHGCSSTCSCLSTSTNNGEDYIDPSYMTYGMPDVYFDGAYYEFPNNLNYVSPARIGYNWYDDPYSILTTSSGACSSYHYLGKFKSLDYALTKVPMVQSDNNIGAFNWYDPTNHTGDIYSYHSDPFNHPNANYLWFLNYTSIIHGASGVWMWSFYNSYLPIMYSGGGPGSDPGNANELENVATHATTPSQLRGFTREYFPYVYRTYVSFLSQELGYLVQNNLLSTDSNTFVYTKTDQADPYCIVPAWYTYINYSLLSSNRVPKIASDGNYVWSDLSSENYGLRYTIRSNGSQTIMIVSNPLPLPLEVTLNFSNTSNPAIRSADALVSLFEWIFPSSLSGVRTAHYKDDRNSNINLATNSIGLTPGTVGIPANRQVTVAFGPLDTHVFMFEDLVNGGYAPSYSNGWGKVWTNNGNNKIGQWTPQPSDQYIVGDFMHLGSQQLFCINPGNGTATLYEYEPNFDQWEIEWSNNANLGHISGWTMTAGDEFVAGDFVGDGKDQILCMNGAGSASVIELSGANWNDDWDNSSIPSYLVKGSTGDWQMGPGDRYIVGDWLNLGKKEILCLQDKPFGSKAEIITYSGGKWNYTWSNSTTLGKIGPWSIGSGDKYIAGDFNSTGNQDVLLACNSGSGDAMLLTWSGGFWSSKWNNSATPGFIAGMGIPGPDDALLVGNLYNNPNEDDFMLMQGQNVPGADWSIVENVQSFNPNWVWSNHDAPWTAPETGYLNDWPLFDQGSSLPKYFLIKPEVTGPAYLMAMRSYSNNGGCGINAYLVNMYRTSNCSTCPATHHPVKTKPNTDSLNTKKVFANVFPNPANTTLNVQLQFQPNETATMCLYNDMGQQVKCETIKNDFTTLSTAELPVGIYYYRIVDTDGNLIKADKVVIVH